VNAKAAHYLLKSAKDAKNTNETPCLVGGEGNGNIKKASTMGKDPSDGKEELCGATFE